MLTTHSMDEADALCGRIGIMAHGQLRCLGPSLHLKGKFGDGFKVEVAYKDGQKAQALARTTDAVPFAACGAGRGIMHPRGHRAQREGP